MSRPIRLTPARRAWLERLEREGIVSGRTRGSTGYQCMQAGWTQWVHKRGRQLRYGPAPFAEGWRNVGEALTEAGRLILQEQEDGSLGPSN